MSITSTKKILPWSLIVVGVILTVAGVAITFVARPANDKMHVPPRAAATACHMDLEAISRTLAFVPMNFHERIAAHKILRDAYAEDDDELCRRIGGYVLQRFYARNLHGEKL